MAWSDLVALTQGATRGVFAEECTYAPPGGSPVLISGEFDAAALQVELSDGVAVQTVGPRLSVRLVDLPTENAAVGATVNVRNVAYTVSEIEPDGHGLALLRLVRA